MGSTYVEVLYDFVTCESDEISLLVGDIVVVTRQVDDNWLCGKLHGKEGNFPANHVRPLAIPPLQPGQKLFRATRSFRSEVDGDLGFQRDDLILGIQEIDANWWQGSRGAQFGIFPVTHVKELEIQPETSKSTENVSSTGNINEVSSENAQDDSSGTAGIGKAKALMDLVAQLDDELGFNQGDIITIIEVLDSDFAIGQCKGQIGMFPLTFVEVMEGNINLNEVPKHEVPKAKFRWWEEDAFDETNTDPVFTQETDVSDVNTDSSINHEVPETQSQVNTEQVNNSLNEIKTKTGSLKREFQTHRRSGSYTADNTRSQEAEVTPYGRTLYPFQAENSSELSFSDNEIVTIYRHVDDQWMEGSIDGRRGLFPAAYIEIIVDCARTDKTLGSDATLESEPTQVKENATEMKNQDSSANEEPEVEMYGRVLYDFKAVNPKEIEMQEGDTVTILRKLDEHWFEAKHDDGRVGFCPVTYVEVIVAEPAPSTPTMSQSMSTDTPPLPTPDTQLERQRSQSMTSLAKPPLKPKPALKPKPNLKPTIAPRRNLNTSPSDKQQHVVTKSMSLDATLEDHIQIELKSALPSQPRRPHSEYITSQDRMTSDHVWSRSVDGTIPEDSESSLPSTPSPLFMEGASRSASSSPRPDSNGIARPRPVPSRSIPCPPARPTPPVLKRTTSTSSTKRAPPPRPTGPRPVSMPPPRENINLRIADNDRNRTTALESAPTLVPTRPAPIPTRPAPRRPVPAQRRSSSIRKQKGENLIDLSPENDQDTPSKEALHELEKRLKQLQDDTEFYVKQKQSLEEQLAQTTSADEQKEMQENIEFCSANIAGFQEEIKEVKEELYIMEPKLGEIEEARKKQEEEEKRQKEEAIRMQEEMKIKRKEKRAKVLEELLNTEQDYLHSLHLCIETFLTSDIPKCPHIDFDVLFGNIVEVMEVSQKLLKSLKCGIKDKDFNEQIAGQSFVNFKEELTQTYGPYCRNHDDVISVLEKYDEMPEVQEYLTKMVDVMRKKMTVFDLGSVLIKPVQRILKYPLLLNEIIKSTEDDHPDKPHLLAAIKAMTEVAAHINEYKRRKDLVMKYRKEADQSLSDKFGRFTVHSTKKKFTRAARRMVGVTTIDEGFNKEERKFTNLDKAVRSVLRNVAIYLDQLQDAVASQESVGNDIIDYYGDHGNLKDVEQFAQVHNTIAADFYKEFREDVEVHVVQPLNTLLLMFQGPTKVIKKRQDKLLDYESFASKTKGLAEGPQLRALKAELQAAKNNYEALNAQLLDELPKLYVLSLEVVQDCVGRLIYTQQKFLTKTLEQMYKLLSLSLILGTDDSSIMEAFNVAHVAVVDKLSDLSFIPRTFNPRLDEKAPRGKRLSMGFRAGSVDEAGLLQSDSQRVFVKQQYPANKLFQVVQDAPISQMMDLALPLGSIIGIIKEGDPMGNKDRWFVDNGAQKGFVLKRYLAPVSSNQTGSPSTINSVSGRSGSPAQPSSSPVPPPPEDLPVKTSGSSEPAPVNLMDLSSPEPLVPARATPIPTDLDFFSTGASSDGGPSSVWYEKSFWDEAAVSPPSILTSEASRSSTWYAENSGEGAVHQSEGATEQSSSYETYNPKAVEASNATESNYPMGDLPPDYSDVMVAHSEQSNLDSSVEYYQAVYAFSARSEVEVSLEAGEVVRVIQTQDLDGNSEWWLVEASAGQGYAPANYLYKIQ